MRLAVEDRTDGERLLRGLGLLGRSLSHYFYVVWVALLEPSLRDSDKVALPPKLMNGGCPAVAHA
jgi:hypothetical protein